MLTQLEFDNLQVGDKIQVDKSIGEVQAILNKVILILWDDDEINHYCFGEINFLWKLIKPIQYNQGFEIREYPDRPVVLVGDEPEDLSLRFLVEVTEDKIITIIDGGDRYSDSTTPWKLIKKVD